MPVRMSARTAPLQRTLSWLRAHGWIADIAERSQGPISHDLFGCIDVVAVHPTRRETLFVQCTSASNFASRLRKTMAQPETRDLLRGGVRIEIWGWGDEVAPRVEQLRLAEALS
jgi:hypothetical protein